jgi:hypothetical protein
MFRKVNGPFLLIILVQTVDVYLMHWFKFLQKYSIMITPRGKTAKDYIFAVFHSVFNGNTRLLFMRLLHIRIPINFAIEQCNQSFSAARVYTRNV